MTVSKRRHLDDKGVKVGVSGKGGMVVEKELQISK